MYNTGQREPKPRSPHHFSSPTQKLLVLPKTCQVHPNVAGVIQKMPVTPKSCQFHTKVASFTQKLPVSSKCCWCQPENAGFTKKLPVLHKSSCLPSEKISASPSTKSNWFHLKIDVLNQKLVSPKSSWCDLKVATSTQSCRVQPKVAGCHTDLKLI